MEMLDQKEQLNSTGLLIKHLHGNCGFKKIIQLSVLLLLTSSTAFAAPTISNITKSTNSVTIIGSNFGTKPIPAPLHFDDFSEGIVGNSIGTHSTYWSDLSQPGNRMFYSTDYIRVSGHKSAKATSNSLQTQSGQILKNNVGFAATGKIYINYWQRFDWGTATGALQLKTLGLDATIDSSGNATSPSLSIFNWRYSAGYTKSYLSNYYSGTGSGPPLYFNYGTVNADLMNDVGWYNVIVQVDMGTPATANGSSTIWLSDATFSRPYGVNSQSNVMILGDTANKQKIDAIKLRMYSGDANTTGATPGEATHYFDSVYIDNSWARVELCDTATWAASKHCEIQLTTAWAPGQISFKPNPGSFAYGQKVYVYVIDSNGDVSSNNAEYIIGKNTGVATPPAPERIPGNPNQ